MSHFYLALCVAGTVVPYSQFVPFIAEHGFDMPLLVSQLFANRISSFFALDVVISAIALLVFVSVEGRRKGIKHVWLPILGTLTVGVSLGLPLFLFMRERRITSL